MATSGATPPTPPAKREFTDEQKRTFALLGVAGVLAVIVGAIYIPGMLSGGSSAIPVAPTPAPGAPGAGLAPGTVMPGATPGALPGATPGASSTGGTSDTSSGTPTANATPPAVALVTKYRQDPFVPFIMIPPPEPPPIEVDPPVSIMPVSLNGAEGSSQPLEPLNLPHVDIPRVNVATQGPRDAFPPVRQVGSQGTASEPQPSYDKRLSGYLISEKTGIRALLEINKGDQVTTSVVRPGDEVDGIRILSIQTVQLGGSSVVRMLVRQPSGQQEYVDLKPAPQQATGAGGEGGAITPAGGPGGFGAAPGRF